MAARKVNNEIIVGEDMTEEEVQEAILEDMKENEDDYLRGLLEAADDAEEEEKELCVSRKGRVFFKFRIHSLSDEKLHDIRKKYTLYEKNRRTGSKVAVGMDTPRLRSSIIYNATVGENGNKIWDDVTVQEGLRRKGKVIINALDVIDAVLLPGEKDMILEAIDELSGFNNDESNVEKAKNL